MAARIRVLRLEHVYVWRKSVAAKRAKEPVGIAEFAAGLCFRRALYRGGCGDGAGGYALGPNWRAQKTRGGVRHVWRGGVVGCGSFDGIGHECCGVWLGAGGI